MKRVVLILVGLLECTVVLAASGADAPFGSSAEAYTVTTADMASVPAEPVTSANLDRVIYDSVFRDRSLLYGHVAATLASYLDSPERVTVKLRPSEAHQLLAGRFDEILVVMEDTRVRDLRIEYAYLRLTDCILDLEKLFVERKFRFKDQGRVDVLLQVTETDINELFKVKRDKLKVRNPHIDFRPGYIRFSGGIRVLFFNNQVRVAGVLRIKNGDEVHFRPRWMNLDFLPVPGFIMRTIAKRVNPMATFDSFKFKLDLSIVETTHDRLYIASEAMRDEVEQRREADLAAHDARRDAQRTPD